MLFQTGYFLTFGIEIISFLSINKVLLNTAVLIPIFATTSFFIFDIAGGTYRHAHAGGRFKNLPIFKFIENPLKLKSIKISVALSYGVFVAVIFVSFFFFEVRVISDALGVFVFVLTVAITWFTAIWWASVIQVDIDKKGYVIRRELLTFGTIFSSASFITGLMYATHVAGTNCEFSVDGETVQFVLYVASDDELIGKIDDKTIIINKNIVGLMTCSNSKFEPDTIVEEHTLETFEDSKAIFNTPH